MKLYAPIATQESLDGKPDVYLASLSAHDLNVIRTALEVAYEDGEQPDADHAMTLHAKITEALA